MRKNQRGRTQTSEVLDVNRAPRERVLPIEPVVDPHLRVQLVDNLDAGFANPATDCPVQLQINLVTSQSSRFILQGNVFKQ